MKKYIRSSYSDEQREIAKNLTYEDIHNNFYNSPRYRYDIGRYLGKTEDEAKLALPKCAKPLTNYEDISKGDLFLAYSRYWQTYIVFRYSGRPTGKCFDSCGYGYDLIFRSDEYPYVWVERQSDAYYPVYKLIN